MGGFGLRRNRLVPAAGVVVAVGVLGCGSSGSPGSNTARRALGAGGAAAAPVSATDPFIGRGLGSDAPPPADGAVGAASTSFSVGPASIGQQSPRKQQALAYVSKAQARFIQDHTGCRPQLGRQPLQALDYRSPSQAMLSTFGVLKRSASPLVPVPSEVRTFARVYVNYVRVASRRFGSTFDVIPVTDFGPSLSTRCLALQASTLRASIAHAPREIRAQAFRIADRQTHDAQDREAICVFADNGAGSCQPFRTAAIAGGFQSIGSPNRPGATFVELVPNDVAEITVRFSHPGPSAAVTVPVINNLAVWKMTNETASASPTIQWQTANGRSIRTIHIG
jgi:hypothetical protein